MIDERSDPDFRGLYGELSRRAVELDAAVSRIRLGGMDLGRRELGGLRRVRLVVARVDALSLASEADALAADPARRRRIDLLATMLERERLEVRIAPLAGWSPDFSCFRLESDVRLGRELGSGCEEGEPEGPHRAGAAVLIGPHWFERPYPHPGPALGVLLHGRPAHRARARFEEVWGSAHDLGRAMGSVLADALRKAPSSRGNTVALR